MIGVNLTVTAYQRATEDLIESVRESLCRVDLAQVEKMVAEMLASTNRPILVLGAGRSSLIAAGTSRGSVDESVRSVHAVVVQRCGRDDVR